MSEDGVPAARPARGGGVGAGSLTRDEPSAFAPPPAFGPFRVLHQIGVGALGPVFRTYEPTRDRLVAVKVFRLDITPEQAKSLANELSRAADAGLFHPSIVEPIAAGVEGTVAYRAEEYVAAETLDVALRHYAPATVDKALPFITQLAGAIDFARAAGVGHGALHPRDVFVTPEETRASGFGVVDALERVGLRAPVRRPYSAPERIKGGEWGTPADVFSLGAIAYELLTARRPSGTGAEIGALAGANVGEHADVLLGVLAMAMDPDPSRRHPTALAFAGALEAAARGEGRAVPIAAAATATAAPRAPAAPVTAAASDVEDDIAAERDEDEAHHEQSLREREDAEAATLFGEEVEEAEADRLMIDAAAVASDDSSERYRAEFQPPPVDRVAAREIEHATSREAARGRRIFDSDSEYRAGAVVPAQGSRVLPLAAMLSIGLLVGFAVGYGVGTRNPGAPPDASTIATQPAAPAARSGRGGVEPGAPAARSGRGGVEPGVPAARSGRGGVEPGGVETAQPAPSPAPPGKDWSEQTVTQPGGGPAARSGRGGVEPQGGVRQQPSATPPPVPTEAPSGPPAARRPAATAGRVVVESIPTRAGVMVNGRWRGRTPLEVEKLPFGKYTVRVVQPGYVTAQQEFSLWAGDPTETLSVRLQRQPPARPAVRSAPATPASASSTSFAGSIYVDSRPRGARVLVDGRAVGTTPLSIPDVPIGAHVVRLELPDHRIWSSSTRVTAGQTSRVTGSLERVQ